MLLTEQEGLLCAALSLAAVVVSPEHNLLCLLWITFGLEWSIRRRPHPKQLMVPTAGEFPPKGKAPSLLGAPKPSRGTPCYHPESKLQPESDGYSKRHWLGDSLNRHEETEWRDIRRRVWKNSRTHIYMSLILIPPRQLAFSMPFLI